MVLIMSYMFPIFSYTFLYVSLCFAIFCYVFLYFSTAHIFIMIDAFITIICLGGICDDPRRSPGMPSVSVLTVVADHAADDDTDVSTTMAEGPSSPCR